MRQLPGTAEERAAALLAGRRAPGEHRGTQHERHDINPTPRHRFGSGKPDRKGRA